jgi:hypothetical protein
LADVFRGKSLTFVKYEFYRARDVITREAWAPEYVWIYDLVSANYFRDREEWGRRARQDAGTSVPGASPHFILLTDGKLVIDAVGKNGWRRITSKRQELLPP